MGSWGFGSNGVTAALMENLTDLLTDATRRRAVIDDCVQLVDNEVKSKGGLGGIAIKGAYAVVKAVKPSIIREAVESLLEEFVSRMAPFYTQFRAQTAVKVLVDYLSSRAAEVASALLQVTDTRVQKVDNRTIKAAYDKLRPTGAKHVESAVPGIAQLLMKHVGI